MCVRTGTSHWVWGCVSIKSYGSNVLVNANCVTHPVYPCQGKSNVSHCKIKKITKVSLPKFSVTAVTQGVSVYSVYHVD